MGFEEDYRQGLRDKHWGRAIKAFATGGSDDSVSKLIKWGLSRAWREMARSRGQANILDVMERYAAAHCKATAISQMSLFPNRESRQEVIDGFLAACTPVI